MCMHSSLEATGSTGWHCRGNGRTRDRQFLSGILLSKGKGKIPPRGKEKGGEGSLVCVLKEEEWRKVFRGMERLVERASEAENLNREPDLDQPTWASATQDFQTHHSTSSHEALPLTVAPKGF